MGREIRRVPLDFDHEGVWPGFKWTDNCKECEHHSTDEDGSVCAVGGLAHSNNCPHYSDPPTGSGYQIWETVSEGSPCSPVFATEELLIEHLHENGAGGTFGPCSRAAAREFVKQGWCMTLVGTSGGVFDGINQFSALVPLILAAFDKLSDDIIDDVDPHSVSDAHFVRELNDYRVRLDKYVQVVNAALRTQHAALAELSRLPEEVRIAAKAFEDIRNKLYPEYENEHRS